MLEKPAPVISLRIDFDLLSPIFSLLHICANKSRDYATETCTAAYEQGLKHGTALEEFLKEEMLFHKTETK